MKEQRLTEYTEGRNLWLPKGARILVVRHQGTAMASYVWTVLEDASPSEKTLRRFVVLEINDVYTGNKCLDYIGAIGTEGDTRAVFEVVSLCEAK